MNKIEQILQKIKSDILDSGKSTITVVDKNKSNVDTFELGYADLMGVLRQLVNEHFADVANEHTDVTVGPFYD